MNNERINQVLWHLIVGGLGAIGGLLILHYGLPPVFLFLTGEDPYLFLFYPPVFYLAWKILTVVVMYTFFPIVVYFKMTHTFPIY